MAVMPRSFAPRYDIHIVADDRLLLIAEDEVLRLDGEGYVAHALGHEADIPDHLLVELSDLPPGQAAWWDELGLPGRGGDVPVAVVAATGELAGPASDLARALAEDGATVVPADQAGLLVVAVDDYLDPQLAAIDRPFLPWRPRGRRLWLGPVLGADGPCWTCLATRLAQNRPADYRLGPDRWLVPRPMADTPAIRRQAVAWAALELGRILAGAPGGRDLLTLDLGDGSAAHHPVTALPHCPACGGRVAVLPDDVPARLARQESALTGILAPPLMISPEPGLHLAFAAAQLGGPAGPAAPAPLVVAVAGKGRRPEDAVLRARAEAVERHSGAWAGDRPVHRAPARDLPGAILPPGVAGDEVIDWCEARSVLDGTPRWLAAATAWYGYRDAARPDLGPAHSIGCAAGPTSEAAILAGLMELVERDALARWWHGMRAVPGLAESDGGWLLALPHPLNLPVIVALATDPSGVVVLGAAADIEAGRAAERARLERGQIAVLMAAERHGLIVDPVDPLHARLANWRADTDIAASTWLRPSGALNLHDLPPVGGLPACIDRLRAAGHDLVVLDQTRPEIGVPVVRVVVPGMMAPVPDDDRVFFL